MVKFKGRSSLKQYMPMKPIKRGFKVWCRCDSHNGFTCCFQVYLGKTDSVETGLGVRVILDMACDILNKGFHIYCNNFFACPELAAKLGMNKTYCIGTVRSIRVGFTKFNPTQIKGTKIGEDISNIESFEINPPSSNNHRNHSEVDSRVNSDAVDQQISSASTDEADPSSVAVVDPSSSDANPSGNNISSTFYPVHWKDKKEVFFVNTVTDPRKVTEVRRKKVDGSTVRYPCPLSVHLYNKYMGRWT